MKERIFLIGGYDLEMLTIKELLQHNKIRCYDRHLTWDNAFLMHYNEELNLYGDKGECEIYGVELGEEGVGYIPVNYHRIDHHNDYNHLPSALEQTASILHIELTREQRLIAANDKGYIPAMQQLGATVDEIQNIRRKDRKAQGVNQYDELLAKEAIKEKAIENNIIVIHSGTNRFSSITDRLFPYEKLLILTNDELVYYGKGKNCLVACFTEYLQSGKMFHGGGDCGFIGTIAGAFSEKELAGIKSEIIKRV